VRGAVAGGLPPAQGMPHPSPATAAGDPRVFLGGTERAQKRHAGLVERFVASPAPGASDKAAAGIHPQAEKEGKGYFKLNPSTGVGTPCPEA
jgi:hypothetical protein